MPTIRLVPSNYGRSNTNYVTVTNPTNMYNNTDHTDNYASIRGRNNANNTYYAFINGFNFGDVPSNVEVTSFKVKIRAYRNSYLSTNASYLIRLASSASSSSAIANTTMSEQVGTSADVYEIPTGNLTWNTLSGYGSGFSIEVPLRSTASQYPYLYVYGAEIEVTYGTNYDVDASSEVPDILVDPTHQSVLQGESATVMFDVDDISGYLVTDNGTDVTSSLVQHAKETSGSITATAESFTTGFSGGSNMAFYTSSSSTGHNFEYAVGHTAESPGSTASGSGSWTYVKDGSSSTSNTGYADFVFDFSEIPIDATITSVTVKCYGAVESSNQSTSHSDITLFSGNTQKGTMQKFTSSTNSIITISSPGTWTRQELQSAKLRFAVGYYGGHLFGITWTVTYTVPPGNYYTYTINNVSSAHTLVLKQGSATAKFYIKVNGAWQSNVTKVYKKINGSWVQQTNYASVFDPNTNYVKGN